MFSSRIEYRISSSTFALFSRSKMVQDNTQIRRQGPYDFMAFYEFSCARQDSVPLPAVKLNLDKGMLDFNGDRVKLTDWPPILHSISINKHLLHIAISSTFQGGLASADSGKKWQLNVNCAHPCRLSNTLS